MLTIIDTLPIDLLDVDAHQLHEVLAGPTLIHLAGRRSPPLFVSALLHGNEDVGLKAIQQLLKDYADRELPRSLSIFIGNVEAARHGLRRLEHQPDYNRIWLDTLAGDTPEHQMVQKVKDEMRNRGVFASVDLHNNTGLNPHYACINRLDHRFFHIATLFNRTVVYFLRPDGVQSMAFAELCPAVTLECGQVGQLHGTKHAIDYLHACLQLSDIPTHPIAEHDIDLFHTVAVVKIPEDINFEFSAEPDSADICFASDIDHLNFRELPEGTMLGKVRPDCERPLDIHDENGRDVYDYFFRIFDNELQTARPIMPSMLTLNEKIIRQDCLCYLMERIPINFNDSH